LAYPAAVCAVLIGCLPTYAHVGVAAPVLLSLLRLIQGIAVGGELGTAVVFMHELSPSGGKTKGGSIIFVGVTAGIMMGQIVALIVNAAIPTGENLVVLLPGLTPVPLVCCKAYVHRKFGIPPFNADWYHILFGISPL
jgi:MFS family permease